MIKGGGPLYTPHGGPGACYLFRLRLPTTDFFLAAPAPAPDFFPKRLQLLVFFPSGSGSRRPKTCGSGSWILVKFDKIIFPPLTTNVQVKLQAIQTSKIILPKEEEQIYNFLREDTHKSVFFLVVGPLRVYPPYTHGLVVHATLFKI